MLKTWVVVADRTVARIFEVDSTTGNIEEIESLVHPEGREADRELTSDRPGRGFERVGASRHSYGPDGGQAKHGAEEFARLVGRRIGAARVQGEVDRVVLVAAPATLGLLRGQLDAPTRQLVVGEYDLNLAHLKAAEIQAHLPEHLGAVAGLAAPDGKRPAAKVRAGRRAPAAAKPRP